VFDNRLNTIVGAGIPAGFPWRHAVEVLFKQRFWAGIADGSVTVAFRRWARPHARVGRTRRTVGGIIEVTAVDVVTADEITRADATAAGYEDVATLLAEMPGAPDRDIYRVRFRLAGGDDPREVLAATADLTTAELDALHARLRRIDGYAPRPWTLETLRLIERLPEVRARQLADEVGREMESFKVGVRKLKNMGLLHSSRSGYWLSARGRAYLAHVATPADPPASDAPVG
jgi:hypothetical protein